jgi:hypothetical protein
MNFNLAKMLVLIAFVSVFAQAVPAATPLWLTVYERSGTTTSAHKFSWTDPRLNVQITPGYMNAGNADFVGDANEFYDIFRLPPQSNSPCVFIRAELGKNVNSGFNIARVDLSMSNGATYYFSSVDFFQPTSNTYATDDELVAVDKDLATWTAYGSSYSEPYIAVCEPKDLNSPLSLCCPPWNPAKLAEMMIYKRMNLINGNYTLLFQPTNLFKREMQSYIEYLSSLDPSITMIIIDWTLYNQGTGGYPLGHPMGSSPGNNGTKIGANYFRTWKANGAGNSIEPINPTPLFFPGGPMQVNTWYLVHTGIYLNNNKKFFADSCANNDIYVKVGPKKGGGFIFEVRDTNFNLLDQVDL